MCFASQSVLSAIVGGTWIFGLGLAPAQASTAGDCSWVPDDPAAVVQSCTGFLNINKSPSAWMYFNRGLAFRAIGRLEDAHRDYSKAIELDPAFAAAYANRGNVRILRNDIRGGIADLRKALALDPTDNVTRGNVDAIETALRKIGGRKSLSDISPGAAP